MEKRINNEDRVKTIKMSGEICTYGKTSVLDCHCNDCHDHIVEYLGKKRGGKYKYTGNFTPDYMHNEYVVIERFSTDEREETSSCECFIRLFGGSGGQVEWIPRREIENNLIEASKPDLLNNKE